jgi:pilus assembly protein FimV
LQSALNQPFQAQIVLVSATPDELAGLKIALAGDEAFNRYGLERPAFLSQLQFRVVTDRAGRSVVQVSSRESIAEPFVTLLVEATWPRGRLLREYTVLLDPPVLLPAPAAPTPVQPAETRRAEPSEPAAPITRPAPPPATRPQPAQPVTPPSAAPSTSPAPVPLTTSVSPEGTYGPVQRSETLWAIAERFRPDGVSMNQMMVALFEANPQAFGGNMNVLRVGAVLRMPQTGDVQNLSTSTANAEVQRQTDEWQNRSPRLVLVPPTVAATEPARTAVPEATQPSPPREETAPPAAAATPPPTASANPGSASDRRLLEVQDEELRNLQAAANNPAPEPAPAPAAEASPGIDVEPPQVFTDEAKPPAEAPAAAATPAPAAPVPATQPAPAPAPSLLATILDWVSSPFVLIGVGVAALLLAALWFVRRRRDEPEDVTGRWEALEAEVDDDDVRRATQRMRSQAPEESIVVEEQSTRSRRAEPEVADDTRLRPAQRPQRAAAPPPSADETLSSQTVINLDQADPVAEADFHMAYGLYDQAAELVQKALDAAPNRRDLKLKLLEVFFVWGNKDSFLKAAQSLRKELGQKPDADWDKVVIMGKQICPDEALFSEATSAGGAVDVDLEAGDSPLDLAFDDASTAGVDIDLGMSDSGLDLDLESSATRELKPPRIPAAPQPSGKVSEDSLDIGERTAAGLEAALFEELDKDDAASRTTPDLAADSLAITQESPTIESQTRGWGRPSADSPTAMLSVADVPTVETPTIESPAADAPTVETPTLETPYRGDTRTVEQPGFVPVSDRTAEIDLDDLGLDVKDLEDLPQDLGDLPSGDVDTREQRALKGDDELLSATGVTQVLVGGEDDEDFVQRKTSVLSEDDATMLAPGFDDGTLTGTEVLEHRLETDESGDTSLVKSLRQGDGLDLNLDDLSAALHGADTVEQHQPRSFSRDVFGGGDTPIDLDIGSDVQGADDPTGTEEVSPLDPQTMTEVGTKLDLARAYIDMGDPEGARSILEEVLDEGDPGQRREAQTLMDVLRA